MRRLVEIALVVALGTFSSGCVQGMVTRGVALEVIGLRSGPAALRVATGVGGATRVLAPGFTSLPRAGTLLLDEAAVVRLASTGEIIAVVRNGQIALVRRGTYRAITQPAEFLLGLGVGLLGTGSPPASDFDEEELIRAAAAAGDERRNRSRARSDAARAQFQKDAEALRQSAEALRQRIETLNK